MVSYRRRCRRRRRVRTTYAAWYVRTVRGMVLVLVASHVHRGDTHR